VLAEYDRHVHETLALPDVVLTPSQFHREAYVRYGVDADRIRVVPCGLPPMPVGQAAPHSGGLRIGFLGTLIPSKGAHVLLEAYRLLGRPEVALDVWGHWVPYHGDTGYLDRLKTTAASMPGTVQFPGRYGQEDVARILAGLDVLVVPSLWWESFSLVVREGFLAGVPVVASGHGAMAEAIEHGVSGLLFRPGDAADLAAQLRRLLDEPGLRERLAAHPKRVASVAEAAAAHEALYAALVGRGARRA
jgi:glycosyltransferase involved in cell wall biosynthesis